MRKHITSGHYEQKEDYSHPSATEHFFTKGFDTIDIEEENKLRYVMFNFVFDKQIVSEFLLVIFKIVHFNLAVDKNSEKFPLLVNIISPWNMFYDDNRRVPFYFAPNRRLKW